MTATTHRLPAANARAQQVEAAAAGVRPLERALLTPEEAARVLGIGRSKVYELILSGTLESLKIGACRRVPVEAIDKLVAFLCSEQLSPASKRTGHVGGRP
ncbi:MAG TPA: helix-turn-helix domain-containing protein [Propionicimonas sp.]|jgi:excisionase family DNA binding protein